MYDNFSLFFFVNIIKKLEKYTAFISIKNSIQWYNFYVMKIRQNLFFMFNFHSN